MYNALPPFLSCLNTTHSSTERALSLDYKTLQFSWLFILFFFNSCVYSSTAVPGFVFFIHLIIHCFERSLCCHLSISTCCVWLGEFVLISVGFVISQKGTRAVWHSGCGHREGPGDSDVLCGLTVLNNETLIWNTNWDIVPGLFQSFSRCKRLTLWRQKYFTKGISGHRKIKLLYTETFLSKHLRSFFFATESSCFLKMSLLLLQ